MALFGRLIGRVKPAAFLNTSPGVNAGALRSLLLCEAGCFCFEANHPNYKCQADARDTHIDASISRLWQVRFCDLCAGPLAIASEWVEMLIDQPLWQVGSEHTK